jgi:hypothetical protein
MTHTEELRKRLEAMEDAIDKLKKEHLEIARRMATELCRAEYIYGLLLQKGEEADKFVKLWERKLDTVTNEIEASQTVEKALNTGFKFRSELIDYIKARKVETAEAAMDIAHTFMKKYSPVALPLKAVREGDVWGVDIDVGALAVKVAKVRVDARTGDILSYEIPEK